MKNPFAWLSRNSSKKGDHYSGTSHGADSHDLGRLLNGFLASQSSTGITVNEDTAMRLGAVWACITLLSDTIATLPINVYRRDGSNYVKDSQHYLNDILKSRPNVYMSPTDLKTSIVAQLCTKGIWYAKKETVASGKVVAINPLDPNKMVQTFKDGKIFHKYGGNDIPFDQLVVVRGFSTDGLTPMSPIQYSRESIGLAVSAEKHGASFFRNGASPGLALELDTTLTEQQRKALKNKLKEKHEGAENAFSTMVLEGGIKAKSLGIKNTDAQYIESRKLSKADIATIFRVPPHMIGDLERSTNNNIEHQASDFVKYSLNPYFKRIEEWFEYCLFTPAERTKYRLRFNPEGLLRGDIKSRSEALSKYTQGGIMTVNEARSLEDLPPMDGGDKLMMQGQMSNIEDLTAGSK